MIGKEVFSVLAVVGALADVGQGGCLKTGKGDAGRRCGDGCEEGNEDGSE